MKKETWVKLLIVAFVTLDNVGSRFTWDIFDYTNFTNYLLLSFICWLNSDKNERPAITLGAGLYIALMFDKIIDGQAWFQINDYITYSLAAGAAFTVYSRTKLTPTINSVPIFLAALVKVLATNAINSEGKLVWIYFWNEERTFYEMGNSLGFLILAIYIAMRLMRNFTFVNVAVSVLFISLQVLDFQKNLWGKPYGFGWHEIITIGLVAVVLIASRKLINRLNIL